MLNLFYKQVFQDGYGYMCFYDKDNQEYFYCGFVYNLDDCYPTPFYSFAATKKSNCGEMSIEEAEQLFWSIKLFDKGTLDLGQHPTAISAAHMCQDYIETYRPDAYKVQSHYSKREGAYFGGTC